RASRPHSAKCGRDARAPKSRLLSRCLTFAAAVTTAYAASFAWQTATPESHGFVSARLDQFRDHLVAHKTKIFLLIHDDRIIYEWYGPDFSATKPHYCASMAKALV